MFVGNSALPTSEPLFLAWLQCRLCLRNEGERIFEMLVKNTQHRRHHPLRVISRHEKSHSITSKTYSVRYLLSSIGRLLGLKRLLGQLGILITNPSGLRDLTGLGKSLYANSLGDRMLREGLQWKSFLLPWAKRLERKTRPRSCGDTPKEKYEI